MEAASSSRQYNSKMAKRNEAAELLGYFLPNIQTQNVQSSVARTDMKHQLKYSAALRKFHEEKRLYFYPLIFSGQTSDGVDWNQQTIRFFTDAQDISLLKAILPYLIIILLLLILSQSKYRKLC